MRRALTALSACLLGLAGCASSGGGSSASSQPSQIALPGGGSLQFSDGGFEAAGMGKYEDPAVAVKELRPTVAQLKEQGDASAAVAQQRVVAMSMLANALYARYQQTQDAAFLKESVEVGKATLAEVARVEGTGLITGISMPLIMAKSTQETNVPEREAELKAGGAY